MKHALFLSIFLAGSTFSVLHAEKTKPTKKQAKKDVQKDEEAALAKRQEKPEKFWDNVCGCLSKNYREWHPTHFIPQQTDRQCDIFALQNAIPSIMNLDPNLMELVLQKVCQLHGKQKVDLEGWTTEEIVQKLTDALNRLVAAENTANGYDNDVDDEDKNSGSDDEE